MNGTARTPGSHAMRDPYLLPRITYRYIRLAVSLHQRRCLAVTRPLIHYTQSFPEPSMNLRNLLAIILAFVALTASSVVAVTPSEASHGGADHYVHARIAARLRPSGYLEFALQQLVGGAWSERIFPQGRYFPLTSTVDQWLVSTALTLQSPDDPTSETDVRIAARLRASGKVEFALQDRNDDDSWAPRMYPPARYFPTNSPVDRWRVSSPLAAALPRADADAGFAALEALYHATDGQDWTVQTRPEPLSS